MASTLIHRATVSLPTTATVGGRPTIPVDDPVCAVLIFLFTLAFAAHLTMLIFNLRREPRRIFALLTTIFCIIRIAALTMRMVWATYPTDVNIAIVAQVFLFAGVLLLFILNLIFTRRVIKDYAAFGTNRIVRAVPWVLIGCVAACLFMVVPVTVDGFFTTDPDVHRIQRDVQLVGVTFLSALAFAPLPVCVLAIIFPLAGVRELGAREKGRMWARYALLLSTATLLTLGAGFRCGTAFDVRPLLQPAWFHHRACYYCFNFAIEIIVVYAFAFARVDPRYRVREAVVKDQAEKPENGAQQREGAFMKWFNGHVNTEKEVFGGDPDR